jgi:hypothetical protein
MPEAAPAAPAPAAPTAPATPTPAASPAKASAGKPADAKAVQTPPEGGVEKVRVRGYERAAKVKAKLEDIEGPADDSGEEPSEAPKRPEPPPEKKPEPPKPDLDARAKHAEERAKRIAEVARKEREAEAERTAMRQSRTSEQEVEKLRKRLAELEPMSEVFSSEEALLAAAEARGMSAEKLVTWMRTRLTDPNAVAQKHAKTEADKLREEMAQLREENKRAREAFEAERTQERSAREAQQRASSFHQLVAEKSESHPLSASLLKRRGPNALVEFANAQIIPYIPEDYDLDYLHDVTEQYLEWVVGGGESPPADPAANGASHPPKKNGAEKPVTTLSNSLAAGRATVTEEIPLHRLPLEERTRRLKAKLGDE